MIDPLENRLLQLYHDYPKTKPSRRKWFLDTCLKNFERICNLVDGERQDLAAIIFDSMEASNWKIKAVEKAIARSMRAKAKITTELTDACIPAIIGSVARFEAEPGGDIDLDFVIDEEFVNLTDARSQLKDVLASVNEILRKMQPKDNIIFQLSRLRDVEFYGMTEVSDLDKPDHLSNLLIGAYPVIGEKRFNKCVLNAKQKIKKKIVLKELKKRIEEDLTKRRREPVKVGYTVLNYVLRMLALNYLKCEDVDKNYWRICELLEGKINQDFLSDLAIQARSIIYVRRRTDRKDEVRSFVEKKILLNAKHIFDELCLVKAKELA